jgi:hypothetical protein
MYLHLGGGAVVNWSSILAVCDLDNTSSSHLTRDFLKRAERAGRVISVAEDIPKSFVLCQADGESRIYLSQLNAATLFKRVETMQFE